MSDYFLIGNLDEKQFVNLNEFAPAGEILDDKKLITVSSQRIATVLIYMVTTSDSFPLMGAWAKDLIIVARDNDRKSRLYEEMRESWEDITEDVAAGFFQTVEKTSEPYLIPHSAVRCPTCGASTAYCHYHGTVNTITIGCGRCRDSKNIDKAGASWSVSIQSP